MARSGFVAVCRECEMVLAGLQENEEQAEFEASQHVHDSTEVVEEERWER